MVSRRPFGTKVNNKNLSPDVPIIGLGCSSFSTFSCSFALGMTPPDRHDVVLETHSISGIRQDGGGGGGKGGGGGGGGGAGGGGKGDPKGGTGAGQWNQGGDYKGGKTGSKGTQKKKGSGLEVSSLRHGKERTSRAARARMVKARKRKG